MQLSAIRTPSISESPSATNAGVMSRGRAWGNPVGRRSISPSTTVLAHVNDATATAGLPWSDFAASATSATAECAGNVIVKLKVESKT